MLHWFQVPVWTVTTGRCMAAAEVADRRRYVVLGPVEARLDGRALPVAPGKQTLLLAALLARPDQVVPVELLAETVWGAGSSRAAAGSLRALVSKLRGALAGDDPVDTSAHGLLVSAAGGYRLRLPTRDAAGQPLESLDAQAFSSALTRARAERTAGRTSAAIEAYRSALGLWRGAAFSGAKRDDTVGGLVTGEACRLETDRAVAIEERLAAELSLGRHAQLLGELQALVAAEPLRERPVELLMVALYRMGRQQEALSLYRRLRMLLTDELGVEPSADVRALHERLLRHDGVSGTSAPPVSAQATAGDVIASSPGNLPVASSDIVGRDAALERTLEMLAAWRLVTLTGTAGVGKTSLALHAARAAVRASEEQHGDDHQRYADGAWLVELAALAPGDGVIDVATNVLGVHHQQGSTVLERLVEYLRSKRLLLVLDSCEHVIDGAAELVAAIVRGCPHVVILATSREPLGVDGEHVHQVPPLPVPPPSSVDAASVRQAAAASLFLARARAAAPDFDLTDGNAAAVGEICRRLDGVPLAIELAANRMRSFSPDDVVSRLEQRFELLRNGPRTATMRHRTLQAAIEWSYGLLDAQQQRTFERLSVFAGDFSMAAAECVAAISDTSTATDPSGALAAGNVLAARLSSLVDRSMIAAEHGELGTRYRLLETLRAYGRQLLAAHGEEYSARRRHATWVTAYVNDTTSQLAGPEARRAADAVARELDDVRTAHAWALEHDTSAAVELLAGLFRYVEHRLPADVPIWAERTVRAIEASEFGGSSLAPTVYAIAARGAARRGDLDRAKILAERGATAGVAPDDPARRHPLYALAAVALFEGRLQTAGRLAREVEQLSLGADDDWFTVRARTIRSLAHVYSGDPRAALRVADDARALADSTGDRAAIGWSRYATGEALLETDPDQAATLLEEALRIGQATDERYLTGVAAVSATSVRARHGDPRRAAALFHGVIDHWQSGGNWTQQWTTIRNVVELLVRAGCDEPATLLLGALDSSDTASPAFGAAAVRLVAARRVLSERLGAGTLAVMTARGAAMDDLQALQVTCDALGRLERRAHTHPVL